MPSNADLRLQGWQTVAIPFVAGIDTKSALAVVPAQRLAILENGVFTKTGSVKKRAGYEAIPDFTVGGGIEGNKRALLTLGDDLGLVSDRGIYSRTVDVWEERGQYLAATARNWEVAHANRNQFACDVAVANNVAVVVWKYGVNSVHFQCFDATTRAPLSAVTRLGTTANFPSALALGDSVLLLYTNPSTSQIVARVIHTTDLANSIAFPTQATVLHDLDATGLYSVTRATDDAGAITWLSDGTGTIAAGVGVAKISALGALSSVTSVSIDIATVCPSVAYSAVTDELLVAWQAGGANTKTALIPWATMVGAAGVDIGVSGQRIATVALEEIEDPDGEGFVTAVQLAAGAADNRSVSIVQNASLTVTNVKHAHIASQGFSLASRALFVLGHESRTGLQNSYYMYDYLGRCLGALEQGTATGRATDFELPHGFDGYMALSFKRKLDVDDFKAQYTHSGVRLHEFTDDGIVASAEYGAATYLSGCQLWMYDGNAPVEAGSHMFPDVKEGTTTHSAVPVNDFTPDDTGTGLITGKQYNYRFYYEWFNARGERVRSLPMQRTMAVTFASGTGAIIVEIPTLRHTLKSEAYGRQSEISIVVYRTEGDLSSVFFRVSSPDPDATGNNGYLANDFTVDSVTFVDNLTDATITDNERDYFSLNELLNFPVPGPEVLYATQDRLYLAGGGIPRGRVLPSKTHVPGDAVAFAAELEVQPTVDDVTALSSIDENVITFTRDALYLVGGAGFDNTGAGGPFNVARVTSDVGCTELSSVVQVPGGVMFKSAKGIYSIDQQAAVQYIGAPVELYNAQTIFGAHVIPDTNQVVFLCSEGKTLMYDYFYGQWGTFTQHAGTSAVVFGTDYAYMRNDGIVYVRTPETFTDAGSAFTLRIRTGRFRPEDIQGFFQIGAFLVLGEYKSPHQLAVRIFYDRSEVASSEVLWSPDDVLNTSTWGSGATWGSDDAWGGSGALPDYHFERSPRRQKCSQVAFEFEDVITESAGASFELTELLLKIRVRPGLNRVAQLRKI
jgi:hypothetical protein